MENNLTKALLALLQKGIVNFTYRKVDGTIRTAIGTRNLCLACKVLGVSIPMPKGKKENPTAYYDIEKEDWRSFKAENVLAINGVEITKIKGVKDDRIVPIESMEEVDIPLNLGGGIGFGGGMPIGGGMGIGFGGGKPNEDKEPKNLDLGKIHKAISGMGGGMGIGFGGGIPKEEIRKAMDKLDKDIEIPIFKGGKVEKPTDVGYGIALPISGVSGKEMTIDDFARLVAKYVVAEFAEKLMR